MNPVPNWLHRIAHFFTSEERRETPTDLRLKLGEEIRWMAAISGWDTFSASKLTGRLAHLYPHDVLLHDRILAALETEIAAGRVRQVGWTRFEINPCTRQTMVTTLYTAIHSSIRSEVTGAQPSVVGAVSDVRCQAAAA